MTQQLAILNSHQINYVFFHLKNHVEFDANINFIFLKEYKPLTDHDNVLVVFHLSDDKIDTNTKVQMLDTEIPVLFPSYKSNKLFELDNNGNLIFYHDWLKAAFYVLSGYQESQKFNADWIGRFPYEFSIQKKCNVTTVPIVNYYFEIIISGLEKFCKLHSLPFKRKRLFDNFGFFLSHDVDRIAFYHPKEVAFKIKQLMGLAPLYYSKTLTLKLFFKGILFLLSPFKKPDPWWNFDCMINLEQKLGIRSTFYFLEKIHRNMDSRYSFKTPKIKRLIKYLNENGFEVGLHGAIATAESKETLFSQYQSFIQNTNIHPSGIRQHFLKLKYPDTIKSQMEAGLKYDTTLGFAEHEGFRNGYCYPFRPYDHQNDQMLDIWELPLVLMEVSVLGYKNEPYQAIESASLNLINEVKKFGGFYSMLWHNCRLDEYMYPGVTEFYEKLLNTIMAKNPEVVRGVDLLNKVKHE